jgi:hypothetical protein
MNTLWNLLKKIFEFIFRPIEGCDGSCEYKIPCDCGQYGATEKKSENSKS